MPNETVDQEKQKEESENILNIMATQKFREEFSTSLRTRWPLFYITTKEEKRLLTFLKHYARANGYDCYIWDVFRGLVNLVNEDQEGGASDDIKNPLRILEHILGDSLPLTEKETGGSTDNIPKPKMYVLLDYFRFIETKPPDCDVERRLKAIANLDSTITTIITGPVYHSTEVLEDLMPLVEFPFPNREELGEALTTVVSGRNVQMRLKNSGINEETDKMREDIISAMSGLTLPEAETALSKSLVKKHKWHIPTILEEKKQVISKGGILEYYDKTIPIDQVGGLKNLVKWIKIRKSCFSKKAEEYGLEKPKGMLLLGFPGTGKSLVCKVVSNLWQMPLLRLDFGTLFQSFVGESEQRARLALKQAESVAPCVLGDTSIIVNNKKETIESFFNDEMSKKDNDISVFVDDSDNEIQKVVYIGSDKEIWIKGFKDGDISDIKLKAITRTCKKENIIKIKTKSGKEIFATKDHLLMDSKGGMKKMKEFKLGDTISIVYSSSIQGDIMQKNIGYEILNEEIVSVEEVEHEGYVYDACCDDPHLYLTNDFVSHNCCLWIDEIEKALSGGNSGGRTDGGTTMRVLSTFLTWMQEKEAPVFVIATANDHEIIPAEFLRAGRFDEIFFVDLPNEAERKEIFSVLLKKKGYKVKDFNLDVLASKSKDYSGAEIEKAIAQAMLIGFQDKQRKITTVDVENEFKNFNSLFTQRKDKFEELKEWADECCVKANADESKKVNLGLSGQKNLDI
jgi:ATP-dependent 26S proteasome regulatory subunit